jgi:hypothetical protein
MPSIFCLLYTAVCSVYFVFLIGTGTYMFFRLVDMLASDYCSVHYVFLNQGPELLPLVDTLGGILQ